MLGRALFNVVLFGLLLAGIGTFLLKRSIAEGGGDALTVVDVAVVAVLGALWAGLIVAAIETRVYAIESTAKRCAIAGVAGAAAYVGLFSGVSFLAGYGPQPLFLILGLLLGGVSHAVRARLYGGARSDGDPET